MALTTPNEIETGGGLFRETPGRGNERDTRFLYLTVWDKRNRDSSLYRKWGLAADCSVPRKKTNGEQFPFKTKF